MQDSDSGVGAPGEPSVPMNLSSSSSRDVDLPGTEKLGAMGKLGMLHPMALLLALGVITTTTMTPLWALFAWVAVVGGLMGGSSSKAVARRSTDEGKLISPTGAMSRGYLALGGACIAAMLAGGLGETAFSFYVLNGLWAAFTMWAVRGATKTDAQSGWIAGATSQTAAALFFGVPLMLHPGVHWVVRLTPLFSAVSLWQTWKFMGSRGTARSRAALNAAGASALGTLAFLPATASLLGTFSLFEAMCHLTVSMGSLMLPIWAMKDRIRPALAESTSSDISALPSSDHKALPSE